MMGQRPKWQRSKGAAFLLVIAAVLASCSSQPSKYRHSNDCKCPKWNYVPKPPADSERAGAHPPATPIIAAPVAILEAPASSCRVFPTPELLRKYIPSAAWPRGLSWLRNNPIQVRISRPRQTKLGDYRSASRTQPHIASV